MLAQKQRRSRSISGVRLDRSIFWWLLLVLALLVVVVLLREPAFAQTRRSVELMDRALEQRPDTAHGRTLYREHCASCHGVDGYGDTTVAAPALAGQLPSYIIKQLADIAEGQRTAPEMHRAIAIKPMSTPQALRDVASYLGGLDENPEPELGDGTQLDLGKRTYQARCSSCHGQQGAGHEGSVTPALRGQNYAYLLMRTRDIATGHGSTLDITVTESLEQLTYDELTALADYAARLSF
ncbi:MAG TPA: c-type cytochrome [Steroidobacter sp.]